MKKRRFSGPKEIKPIPSAVLSQQSPLRRLFKKWKKPILFFMGGILLLCAFFLWGLPALSQWISSGSASLQPGELRDPTRPENPPQEEDLSHLQKEAVLPYNTVNDPYLHENEVIFVTASMRKGVAVYDKIVCYDLETKKTEILSGVSMKYDNIIQTKINDDFCIWIDAKSDGGGRIMAYDRKQGRAFAVKDFLYGAPKISLSGNCIAFMQQAGSKMDRLYVYNLETKESVAAKILRNLEGAPTGVCLAEETLIYAVPYLKDGVMKSKVHLQPLSGGEEMVYEWDKYVSDPQMAGGAIAFLSSQKGPTTDLYLSQAGGEPFLVDTEVINYQIGNGFLAYTKGEAIYLYDLATRRIKRLNSSISRGLLVGVNQNVVFWYDVTGGFKDIDVVKYARVEANGETENSLSMQ